MLRSSKLQPTAWGVDVGARVLKAVQLGLSGDELSIQKMYRAPVGGAESAAETIARFIAEHDLSASTVAVNLPSTQTLARFFQIPAPKPDKFRDAVAYELKARIPLAADQTVYDYHWSPVADAVDDAPSSMLRRVTLVAAATDHVQQRLQPWHDSGAAELLVAADSLALINGLVGPFEADPKGQKVKHAPPPAPVPADLAGTAFLDAGAATFNLAALTPSGLWFRGLYLGTEGMNKALAAGMQITVDEADALRRAPQRSPSMRKVQSAIDDELGRLHAAVHRGIDQLIAETGSRPRRLLLCGGLSHQLGWLQRLQRGE